MAASEPSTLQCQICLDTFKQAVALEPCGHTFCAVCLSHHLGKSLGAGQDLACPLRCGPPTAVVANDAVRRLVEELGLERDSDDEARSDGSEHSGEGLGMNSEAGRQRDAATFYANHLNGLLTDFERQFDGTDSHSSSTTTDTEEESESESEGGPSPDLVGAVFGAYNTMAQRGGNYNREEFQAELHAEMHARYRAVHPLESEGDDSDGDGSDSGSSGGAFFDRDSLMGVEISGPSTESDETESDDEPYRANADGSSGMHHRVPLDDARLPLALHSLRTDNADLSGELRRLESAMMIPITLSGPVAIEDLNTIARVSSGRDDILSSFAQVRYLPMVMEVMDWGLRSEAVCVAAAAAVRALCQGPQALPALYRRHLAPWLRVLLRAMDAHPENAALHADCMICMLPLPMTDAFSQSVAPIIVASIKRFASTDALACLNGLLLAAEMVSGAAGGSGRGETDVAARWLDCGAREAVCTTLCVYGGKEKLLFFAALKLLGALVEGRGGHRNSTSRRVRVIRLAGVNLVGTLLTATDEFKRVGSLEHSPGPPSAVVLQKAEMLENLLFTALMRRWAGQLWRAAKVALAVGVIWVGWRWHRAAPEPAIIFE